MNKIFILYLILLFPIFGYGQMTRSSITDPNNPNLDPNWKWYNNIPQTLYFKGDNGIIHKLDNISLPFFDNGSPLVAVDDKKDMYPEDGWMLFSRDFGTSTQAPSQPFFVLYNKYSGVLRYIFYNAQRISYSFFKGELSFLDERQAAAIMTFTDDVKPFLNDFDKSKAECFVGKVNKYEGWGYADFSLFGYDPNLNRNARIRINIVGINSLKLSAASTDFTLEQIMDNSKLSGSKGNGVDVIKSINEGVKYYNSINSLTTTLKKEVKKYDDDPKKEAPWWYKGVKSLLGKADIIPAIGGIAGFVKTAFFGKDPTTPKPINFKGSLKFEGDITGEIPLCTNDFILNPNAPLNPDGSEYYKVVQNIPIGVFNLVNAPNLYYIDTDMYYDCGGKTCLTYMREMFFNLSSENNELNYVFNEDCGLEITSMGAAIAFSNREPDPEPFFHPELLMKCVVQVPCFLNSKTTEKVDPIGIALKITFKVKNPVRNTSEERVLYKVYPFKDKRLATSSESSNVGASISYYYITGENLDLDNSLFSRYSRCKYFIADNTITVKDGFEITPESLPNESKGVQFIAGKSINFNGYSKILSNKKVSFKAADFNSLQTRSSLSVDDSNNGLADLLKEIEVTENLDFNKLRIHTNNVFGDIVESITNTEQIIESQEIRLFPNPTTGIINISQVSNMKIQGIEIRDMLGRMTQKISYDTNPTVIDLTGKHPGIYLVRILHEGGFYDYKIVLN